MSDILSGQVIDWTKEDFKELMEWSASNIKFKYKHRKEYKGNDFNHTKYFSLKELYNKNYRASLSKITEKINLTQAQLFVMTIFNLGVSVGNLETKDLAIYEIKFKLKERTTYNLNVMDYLIAKYKITPEDLK